MNRGIVACMADERQLELIRQGVDRWNTWRKENPQRTVHLDRADLSGRDLSQADLSDAHLDKTDFSGADLSRADLSWAKLGGARLTGTQMRGTRLGVAHLIGANLRGAQLGGAVLESATIIGADLSEADLSEANLIQVNFSKVKLAKSNFHQATLSLTVFGDVDLSEATGLHTCQHLGPTTIDHRTIARSWPLPVSFLRGCGLPESLITYLPSILNQPIQFYSVFISYSTRDQEFADRLHADLQNKGVRCWFAPHTMQSGRKIHEQIDEAIRVYDRLLLILSDASMESEWVKTEIAHARQKELNQSHQVLFPIGLVPYTSVRQWKCFDSDTGKDSAREIREYFIPDFSNWKDHDQYRVAFDRLVKGLKADEQPSASRQGHAPPA
jgi:hypothetical protein